MTINLHDPPPRRLARAPWPPAHGPRADALLSAAFPGSELPRVITGHLTISTAVAGSHVSISPPIPFPWELIALYLFDADGAGGLADRVGYWVVDNDTGSNDLLPRNEPIFVPPRRRVVAGAGGQPGEIFASKLGASMNLLTQPSYICYQPGRRIAFTAVITNIAGNSFETLYTVRELLRRPAREPIPALTR